MELAIALGIYAIIVIAIIFFSYHHGIGLFSSVILGLIIGQILLNIMAPMYHVHVLTMSSPLAIYYTVQILTPLIVYIYAFICAWKDRRL